MVNKLATPRVIEPGTWREKILEATLRVTWAFSLLAAASGVNNIMQSYREHGQGGFDSWFQVVMILVLYILAILVIGFITLKKSLSFAVRAISLLSIYYVVAVLGLYFTGLSGDGRVFLFAVCILTAILFGQRGSSIALGLSFLTLTAIAYLFVTGVIETSIRYRTNTTDPTAWLSGIVVFVLLSTVTVVSVVFLVRRLEESLISAQRDQMHLQHSEKYYRALIENSSDAVALVDPQGIVLYASPSTWRVIGYTAEEYLGQNAFASVHPEDVLQAESFLRKMLHTPGHIYMTGYRVKVKTGEWRWLEGSVHNLLAEPDIGAIVINYRDVTQRRQAEAALQESEARLQRLNGVLRIMTEINQLIAREQERQPLLDQICHLLIRHREYAFTWIGLVDESGEMCRFAAASSPVDPDDYTFRLNDKHHTLECVNHTIQSLSPLTITPDSCTECPIRYSPQDRSALSLPILRGERILGIWVVYATHTGFFDQEEINLLRELANDLAYALENLQIESQRRRRANQQQALAETAATLLSQLDLAPLLQAITIAARQTLDADRVALYEYDSERDRLRCPYSWGLSPEYVAIINEQFHRVPGYQLLSISEPITIQDVSVDARAEFLRKHLIREGIHSYVVFPLHAPDFLLGALTVYRNQVSQFAPGDLATGQTLAHLLAVAMQNVQLFTTMQKRAEEAETLRQVGAVVAATLERDKTIELILEQLARVIPYDSASVQLLGEGYVEIVGGRGWTDMGPVIGIRFPIPGDNPNTMVIQERRPQILSDPSGKHSSFQQLPHSPILSWLGVPLLVGERVIGMLAIDSTKPDFFTRQQARLVGAFGDQVAVALENARLFEETRRRATEMAVLIELSTSLRTATTRMEIQRLTLDYALDLLEVEEGAILEPIAGQKALQVVEARRWSQQLRQLTYSWETSIAGRVFMTGQPVASVDLSREIYAMPAVAQFLRKNGTRAGVYVPLRSGNEIIGVLCVDTAQIRSFDADEIRLLTAIAEVAGSAIHRATVLETLEQRVQERTVELIEANEQLKQLDRLKDEFVTNVNHELRTPLTNIVMYLDLLHTRGAQSLERYLPVLRRESKRLTQLIEDMLTLSRLEQGQMAFEPKAHILDGLISEVFQVVEARIKAKSLFFWHEPNVQIPPVMVDAAQMVRVFTNLIGNAVAYTPARGRIECQVQWAKDSTRYVEVLIRNSDTLIPPEEITHLFERFYRGKVGRDSGEAGTGLGLAICQEIVARHGGHITVESNVLEGTSFRLFLPVD